MEVEVEHGRVSSSFSSYGGRPSADTSFSNSIPTEPSSIAAAAPSSWPSSAVSSPCYSSEAESYDMAQWVPMSEFEEIPSFRYLSPATRWISRDKSRMPKRGALDGYWREHPNYEEVISRSVCPLEYSSAEELYLRLCEPILVDDGQLSIALDRRTGSRCLMLSASKLDVASANNDHHWKWISREVEEGYWKMTLIPGSRFPKVAELLSGVNLEINGEVDTAELSRQTMYAAFFVFELSYPFGFLGRIQGASITLGFHTTQHTVCLSPERGQQSFWRQNLVKTPQSRSDGWKEVEMGEFFVKEGGGGGDGGRSAVHMSLNGFGKNLKGGLIVHGIEVRPKTKEFESPARQ